MRKKREGSRECERERERDKTERKMRHELQDKETFELQVYLITLSIEVNTTYTTVKQMQRRRKKLL